MYNKTNIKKLISKLFRLLFPSAKKRENIKIMFLPFYRTRHIIKSLKQIQTKLSLEDNIFQFNNVKFFVPNYPEEAIQSHIVTHRNFYEADILLELDKYIPENAMILDIGVNIGNHSLYWGLITKASKIIAFEPVSETYKTLVKNIEINNLENRITTENIALGKRKSSAQIETFSFSNHGATSLEVSKIDQISVISIDEYLTTSEKYDFKKNDVKGFEEQVLKGGVNTLLRCKPYLYIEIHKANFFNVSQLLDSLNAKIIEKFSEYNYLYKLS